MTALVIVCGSETALAAGVAVRARGEEARCLGTAELAARASELTSFAEVEGPAVVEVTLSARAGGGFAASISVQQGTHLVAERRVESPNPDCHDIDAALLVVIDALLAIAAAEPQPEAEPASSTDVEAPPPRSATVKPSAERSAPPAHAPRVPPSATVGATYALGVVPGGTLVARADGRVALGGPWALRVGLGLTPWAAERTLEGAEVRFRSFSGRGAGCFDLVGKPVQHLDACVGVDGGITRTTQSGTLSDVATAHPALWPLASLTLAVEVIRPSIVELSTALGPALLRSQYELIDRAGQARPIYETTPLRWELGVALGAAFR